MTEFEQLKQNTEKALSQLHDCQKLGCPASEAWDNLTEAEAQLRKYCVRTGTRYPLKLYRRGS